MVKRHFRAADGHQVKPFSKTLQTWLQSHPDKTLAGLNQVFAEKSFAIIFLLLMALPALPIPTGGVTHITEIITMLVSLELIAGRRTVWLPKRWLKLDIGKAMSPKAVERLTATIKWFERFSRRRFGWLLLNRLILSSLALIILLFTVAAFVAPPFSGLDTLPALGVVVISLAIILEDSLIIFIGIVLGIIGIGIELSAGEALYKGLAHIL